MRTTFSANVPQYQIDVDRLKAKALDVPISSIFETMQSTFGSLYVNDFTLLGRNYRVSLQSESDFREKPEDLRFVYVKANNGAMIPLDAPRCRVERIVGPDLIERFNAFQRGQGLRRPRPRLLVGPGAAGHAGDRGREAAGGLSASPGRGRPIRRSPRAAPGLVAIGFGILMVFLILSAQYERWSLPIAVLLAVPFAVFGALLAIWLRGLDNDVYFQIGLVTLVGLAAKNAILIVEFAVLKREEGLSAFDAALEGAKLRFRPIVMTSLAFILGVVPLAISTGAGSASRHSIGTGVIGGMLAATFVAIFFIPLFYKLLARKQPAHGSQAAPTSGDDGAADVGTGAGRIASGPPGSPREPDRPNKKGGAPDWRAAFLPSEHKRLPDCAESISQRLPRPPRPTVRSRLGRHLQLVERARVILLVAFAPIDMRPAIVAPGPDETLGKGLEERLLLRLAVQPLEPLLFRLGHGAADAAAAILVFADVDARGRGIGPTFGHGRSCNGRTGRRGVSAGSRPGTGHFPSTPGLL